MQFLADGSLPAGPWLGPSTANEPRALESAAGVRFTTLDNILGPDTVRPAWIRAAWSDADGVIVPWNDYAGRGAVEPTRAHGDATLIETARQIAAFKNPVGVAADEAIDPGAIETVEGLLPKRPSPESGLRFAS